MIGKGDGREDTRDTAENILGLMGTGDRREGARGTAYNNRGRWVKGVEGRTFNTWISEF